MWLFPQLLDYCGHVNVLSGSEEAQETGTGLSNFSFHQRLCYSRVNLTFFILLFKPALFLLWHVKVSSQIKKINMMFHVMIWKEASQHNLTGAVDYSGN